MALTRKMLSAMGVDDEKQDEIIKAHIEVVDALKDERDSLKADAKKATALQKELDELKEATKNSDRSPYKVKYEAKVEELDKLQKEFDDYKADVDAKETASKKIAAYKVLLKEAGVSDKRVDSIIKVTDLDDVELDEDGKAKDADKLKENIKSEWADFIVTQAETGAQTANPATNTGGNKMSKDEILKIKDTAERQKAMLENKELFLK